jgi:anthranilate phosphoribosyltransferase
VVALNTALVLWAAGLSDTVESALVMALEALESGAGWQRLQGLRSALP